MVQVSFLKHRNLSSDHNVQILQYILHFDKEIRQQWNVSMVVKRYNQPLFRLKQFHALIREAALPMVEDTIMFDIDQPCLYNSVVIVAPKT